MLRVHRRAEYLPQIFKQFAKITKGITGHIIVQCDRPSGEVIAMLNRCLQQVPDRLRVQVIEAPAPVVCSSGRDWSGSMRNMWAHRDGCEQAAMVWDDDVLLTDEAIKEIRGHMTFFENDRLDILALQVWDEQHHNTGFPPHWAPAIFKVYPGDDFDPDLETQCTAHPARSADRIRLRGRALHYGYATPEAREAAWASCKTSGRFDAHTLALKREPKLEAL